MKQFPSFPNATPAEVAMAATCSWPLRMTCAPKGGWPDILIVTCPPEGVDDMEAVVVDVGLLLGQVADRSFLGSLHSSDDYAAQLDRAPDRRLCGAPESSHGRAHRDG